MGAYPVSYKRVPYIRGHISGGLYPGTYNRGHITGRLMSGSLYIPGAYIRGA